MIANRRQFLAAGGAVVTALALGGCDTVFARSTGNTAIGLQLFTLRDLFAADPHGTLEKVAAIGYREVEFGGGGYEGMDHAALRRTMDGAGLKAPAIHLGYDALLDDIDGCIGIAQALGADTVVLPYMTENHFTEDAWNVAIGNFNRIAGQLKTAGLGFAYHNHDFEFTKKPGGLSLWERLLADRDRDLIRFELDLFWIVRAGLDPREVIRALPGQVYSYHVKDQGENGWMAAVGTGSIDFAGIFELNDLAGVRHFFVENDIAPDPYLPDVTVSFANLTSLLSAAR